MKNDHVNVYKGTLDPSPFDIQSVIRLSVQNICLFNSISLRAVPVVDEIR